MKGVRLIASAAFIAAASAVTAGCGSGGGEVAATRQFPTVRIPEIVADDPEGAYAYAAEHFWDAFADTSRTYLCDSAHVAGVDAVEVERQYCNFVGVLQMNDLRQAQEGMRRMYAASAACERADTASNVFETLLALTEKYLYDPNSPMRDEDIYGAYAACIAGYGGFSPEKRSIYEYEARLCAMNSRGTKAADFTFRDALGVDRTLYGVKADYILLFFSNPGCPACKEIIETLSGELDVDSMISAGRLAVLNIYIDEDLTAWRDYMPIYPKTWYNGYDPDFVIRGETLYNVRAIPSLYLLGSDKTVLLKDAPEDVVFRELAYIANEGR